jgi:NAD(P)H-dependent nitrite reductase small subunit
MSDFVKVIAASEVAPGRGLQVEVEGQAVAVFNVDGAFFALSGRCPHRGGPLGEGFVEGKEVSCPWHNWTFDVTTGENVASRDLCIPRHEVKLEDGHVWIKAP